MSTHYLQTKDGTIAYDDTGSGPLVICVPSMGDLRFEYRFLTEKLVAARYRTINMDIRGHGETSTYWPDYSVGAIGSDILTLIRSLNSGPAVIVGTSMAAGAAVWAAAEAPDQISGLLLIGPFVRGESAWHTNLLYSLLFARPWGPAMWVRYYKMLYPTIKPPDFIEYCARLRANLQQPGRLEALMHMIKASKAASEARLPGVKAPALVIMGSKDPDFKDPQAEALRIADSLKSQHIMVKDAGHYPHAEMPELTGELILSFLQSLSSAGR